MRGLGVYFSKRHISGKVFEYFRKIGRFWWFPVAVGAVLAVFYISRYPTDRDTLKVLYHAGPNALELLKTLDHFRGDPDPRKYDAARFLIRNMDLHYFREDQYSDHKIDLFAENLDRIKPRVAEIDDSLEVAWANVRSEHMVLKVRDAREVSSKFLITHIDQAFEIWDQSSWKDYFSFEQFCQYFLPYKTNEAKPELWLGHYRAKYRRYTGSIDRSVNPGQWLKILRDSLYATATNHPFQIRRHLSPLEMDRVPIGDCRFDSNWLGMISRSVGLPVVDIYTPQWANTPRGHFWNAWLDSTGNWEEITLRYRSSRIIGWESAPTKVFIRLWGKNDRSLPFVAKKNGVSKKSIPDDLYIWNIEDITSDIIPASKVKIKLDPPPSGNKFAYLSIYKDRKWIPVFWTKVNGDSATFEQMGCRVFYRPLYYSNGQYTPAGPPFYLDSYGSIIYLQSDTSKLVSLKIDRVYPMRAWLMEDHAEEMLGATFEGSLFEDFSSYDTLHCITESPDINLEHLQHLKNKFTKQDWYQDIQFSSGKKYRFIRYRSSSKTFSPIGDLEIFNDMGLKIIPDSIYGTAANPDYLYDGMYGQYFKPAEPGQWGAIDLGKATVISKIRFIPYDIDPATIQKGDRYQLFMWDENNWRTLSTYIAEEKALPLELYPNAVYLLENKSRFVHSRPFVYRPEQDLIVWM